MTTPHWISRAAISCGHARQLIIHYAENGEMDPLRIHGAHASCLQHVQDRRSTCLCSRGLLCLCSDLLVAFDSLKRHTRLALRADEKRPGVELLPFARPRDQGINLPRVLCSMRTRARPHPDILKTRKERHHHTVLLHSVQATKFGETIWPSRALACCPRAYLLQRSIRDLVQLVPSV